MMRQAPSGKSRDSRCSKGSQSVMKCEKSRVKRESQARFCERLGLKCLCLLDCSMNSLPSPSLNRVCLEQIPSIKLRNLMLYKTWKALREKIFRVRRPSEATGRHGIKGRRELNFLRRLSGVVCKPPYAA